MDPKARSLTFGIYLLPFVLVLLDFVSRDHLASTSLPRAEGPAFLHHLSCTLSRVNACLAFVTLLLFLLLLLYLFSCLHFLFLAVFEVKVGAVIADIHKRDSSEKIQSLQKDLDILKANYTKLKFEQAKFAQVLDNIATFTERAAKSDEAATEEKPKWITAEKRMTEDAAPSSL